MPTAYHNNGKSNIIIKKERGRIIWKLKTIQIKHKTLT